MQGLPGLECGVRYKVAKRVEADTTGMISFQYPFKPPVDARKDGKAVSSTTSGGGEEVGTSSTSWTVRLPCKAPQEGKGQEEIKGNSSSGSTKLKHKRGRIVAFEDEDDFDGDAEDAESDEQRNEVFVGEAGPSKNEYLLTFYVDSKDEESGYFAVEKVDSIARLKHVTAVVLQGDDKKQRRSDSKRARR